MSGEISVDTGAEEDMEAQRYAADGLKLGLLQAGDAGEISVALRQCAGRYPARSHEETIFRQAAEAVDKCIEPLRRYNREHVCGWLKDGTQVDGETIRWNKMDAKWRAIT